jgi:hypothetical protein
MFEMIATAFETPELASTNLLSILTLFLSITTAADAHLWRRTREAAKRVTVTVITRAVRQGDRTSITQTETIRETTPAARRLHRNASIHRY